MKNILYLTTVSGTINAFLIPHIKMLLNEGHKVDCACFINTEINTELQNINVFNLPFSRNPIALRNIKAFKELINIQKEKSYDIIHVHTPVASIYGRLLKIIFPEIKVIYTAHGFHFYKGAPKKNWLIYYPIEKICSFFTNSIITMNIEDYNLAISKFKNKNNTIHMINGIGVNKEKYTVNSKTDIDFKKSIGLNEDDFVITMIAEFIKRKNHKQIIEAMKLLTNKYTDIKLLLVGNGNLFEAIKSDIKTSGLDNNIIMLGFRNDIKSILNITDIVCLMSYQEGLPRNIMESMVAKKPIIATNIRGNIDLVEHELNGYIVNICDYNSTANYIEYLYLNRNKLNDMGEKSLEKIEPYLEEKVLEQMKEIYSIYL